MKIIGIGEPRKDEAGKVTDKTILVEMTIDEADMVNGVAGRPHISGRYKAGREIGLTAIYKKVKLINEKTATIKSAVRAIKSSADDIDNNLPLNEE